MFYNAREGTLMVNGAAMNYVEFGSGNKPFIVLPGLSDGLRTVKGLARTLALSYKLFAQNYRVYMFSRKNELKKGYTTKDMAMDQQSALEQLGIEKVYMMGVSQGGMIAQHFAINFPDAVEKLVIGVSLSKQNKVIQGAVSKWIGFAESNDYKSLIIDTTEQTYSTKTIKRYRMIYPFISRIGKPKDFARFIIQADACLTHDTYDELGKINCPTLVIGGDSDKIVGKYASLEMAEKINNSKLILYKGLGHGAYEESKDFNRQVNAFLLT